jgi:hypothetical protein
VSETEQEQTEPTEPTEAEPTEEDEAAEEEEATEEEAPAEPDPGSEDAQTDIEVDAVYAKLETRAKNYVKSVGEILDGAGVPVTICEMCADAYPGVRWVTPGDEMHAALAAVVGAHAGENPLQEDPDAALCERCQGFGAVKLPSHVPNQDVRTCKACNGTGWLDRSPQSGTLQAPALIDTNGAAEPLPGVPLTDDRVASLQAEGFMVMKVPQALGVDDSAHA